MSVKRSVNESCACGGQAEIDYSSDNHLCCLVKCIKCGKVGPVACFSTEAENAWVAEMKRLKGAKK